MTIGEFREPQRLSAEFFIGTEVPKLHREDDADWLTVLADKIELSDEYIENLNKSAEAASTGKGYIYGEHHTPAGNYYEPTQPIPEQRYRVTQRRLFYELLGTTVFNNPLHKYSGRICASLPLNVIANARSVAHEVGEAFADVVERRGDILAHQYQTFARRIELIADNNLSARAILLANPGVMVATCSSDMAMIEKFRKASNNTPMPHQRRTLARATQLLPSISTTEATDQPLSAEQLERYVQLANITYLDVELLTRALPAIADMDQQGIVRLQSEVEALSEEKDDIKPRDIQKILTMFHTP